jgi:hypothetical protein
MSPPRLVAAFESVESFLQVFEAEIASGGLLVRGASLAPGAALGDCTVEVQLPGQPPITALAQLAAVVPGVGVAVMFPGGRPSALVELAERLRGGQADSEAEGGAPEEEQARPTGSLPARLKAMSVTEKMQLALTAERDLRNLLLRDTNKALHLYVLRNPRIGLDEVTAAAKMATLSGEAIKFIAEHRDWSMNPSVCASLARNPQVPVPMVLKLLPRIPPQDLRAIAKGVGRAPIVQAARKLLSS